MKLVLSIAWYCAIGLFSIAVVFASFSAAHTRFEVLTIAALALIYATVTAQIEGVGILMEQGKRLKIAMYNDIMRKLDANSSGIDIEDEPSAAGPIIRLIERFAIIGIACWKIVTNVG